MKIKCPVEYCSYERDTDNYPKLMFSNFSEHFEYHHNNRLLSNALAHFIVKTYYKIEGLEGGRLMMHQPLGFTEEILKSILENE